MRKLSLISTVSSITKVKKQYNNTSKEYKISNHKLITASTKSTKVDMNLNNKEELNLELEQNSKMKMNSIDIGVADSNNIINSKMYNKTNSNECNE